MVILLNLVLGLAVFLYGMHQLEGGVKDLSARRLRDWLLRSTRTPRGSSATGLLLTALLQSSSLVGLMVLAFAAAGILPLVNAVGLLLGANLGTTVTGWLVALLGFKLDLENLAIPLIALGGVSQMSSATASRLLATGQLLLGLGLVLLGLAVMKDSVAGLPEMLSVDSLQGHHAYVYLLFGALLTAIIQSSSAMMIIALAALESGLIVIPEAAALVIGANLGTTSTLLLASLSGANIKRQLAFAHFFFNATVGLLAYFLLLPALSATLARMGPVDPLYTLVSFHTVFNLVGLMIYLPLIKHFSNWIEQLFPNPEHRRSPLDGLPVGEPIAAIPVMVEYVRQLWFRAIKTQLGLFGIPIAELDIYPETKKMLSESNRMSRDYRENYEHLKAMEGEILQKSVKVQQQSLTSAQTGVLTAILETTRAIVYASKTLKDIRQNIQFLQTEESEQAVEQFQRQRRYHLEFYSQLLILLSGENPRDYILDEVERLLLENDRHQSQMDQFIYGNGALPPEPDLISTQLNVNREIHHAAKNFLRALQSWSGAGE